MPARRIDPQRYADPGIISGILFQLRLTWRLLRDPRVPNALKIMIPGLVALYTVAPVDIVPDFLLGLGQLDDLGIILAALAFFSRLAPRSVVQEHEAALRGGQPRHEPRGAGAGDFIDADYTVRGGRL
jgi:uncharacterized membrane protein YkvA (DUF1232 family)